MLKLPKDVLTHPDIAALETMLAARERPLRGGPTPAVTALPFDKNLTDALRIAKGTGHLVQGLELIEATLAGEQKGLEAARIKTGQAHGQRLSRLVLVASDGSERFYRDIERLLLRFSDRVWAFLLDTTSAELGAAFTPKGKPTKALMIDDRKALVLFLRGYATHLAAGKQVTPCD